MAKLSVNVNKIATLRNSRGGGTPDLMGFVGHIIAFGAEWREAEPLLVHCWMGISRSTAAALIIACAANPARDEAEIAQALRAASPTATPNRLIVSLADEQLGRQGRLIAAAASIGQGEYAYRGKAFTLPAR